MTGNKINSQTSANNAINGFAAAWMTLKYIIKVIVNPTDNPKLIKDIPKISLNITPIIIANK